MDELAEPLSEEDRQSLIADFEVMGGMTFRIGDDAPRFDAIVAYVKKNLVPTITTVDEDAGIVTINKRPMGSLEIG